MDKKIQIKFRDVFLEELEKAPNIVSGDWIHNPEDIVKLARELKKKQNDTFTTLTK